MEILKLDHAAPLVKDPHRQLIIFDKEIYLQLCTQYKANPTNYFFLV